MSKRSVLFEQDLFRVPDNTHHLMQSHEAVVDFLSGRMTRCHLGLFDALDSIDKYSTDFVEYVDWSDEDEYASPNNKYCGFNPHFLKRDFPKPHPASVHFRTTKRKTSEEAEKIAEELLCQEEKLKKKVEKKKQKKMRQRERRRLEKLEKENADKDGNKQVDPGPVKSKPAEGEWENKNKSNNSTVVSSDEDDQESVADEQEELDLNSSFVTNAAAIAKRKLEQKPKLQKKEKRAENANPIQMVQPKKSTAQPLAKDENEGSGEVENEFITKSMELAVMGNAYAQSGDLNMAVTLFTDAIKHNPKEYKLFGNRSFCYEKMQQYEKALIDADVALSLNPTWIKGLYRKGRALVGLKRYYDACLTYKEVLKLDPSCHDATEELMRVQIICLMEMGFTREQSSNALIIHGTVEKALEALSGIQGSLPVAPMPSETHEQEWVTLERNPQPPKFPLRAVPQNQPGSNSKPSSPKMFPIWVGNLVPSITSQIISKRFSRFGPVVRVNVLPEKSCAFVNYTNKEDCAKAIRAMHGYTIAGTCLVVRYPERIHTHLGVCETASTDSVKVSKLPDECHFWRTTGCIKNNRCSYRHVPEHKGIDQPKAK